nr:putative ribosome biogenesis protein slx9-like [Ipomoea batatas]
MQSAGFRPSLSSLVSHRLTAYAVAPQILRRNNPADSLFSMGKARPREDASTKADRKFEKKVQFYTKVRDTVASLSAQKAITKKTKVQRRKKKLQAYDLSSLSEFLPELEAHQKPKAELKLNRKTKQKLVLKEGDQLRAVIGHPAFQSNPLQAIYQHLQGTQPLDSEKPKRDRKKGKGKKEKSKPQLMET